MLFNSLEFLVFLPIVYGLYLATPIAARNLLLLIASYVFYGAWDPRFLILIAFSTVVDYGVSLGLARVRSERARRSLLLVSLVVNLGLLGFFKYFDFFVSNLADLLTVLGFTPHLPTLRIVLPVGISFYTFQTLSYTIDVYRGRVVPTRSLVDFATYVAFFPQLVAGPIERASHLLPQIQDKARRFQANQIAEGGRLMVWGFFKKLVIADNLAAIADAGFGDSASGYTACLGVYAFALQIYCDFSGYSDIARGSARLFGIDLMQNFRSPYLATSITDFWRRWHISLSTWFRDYLYIPLGGNRGGRALRIRNVLITFVLSGVWHGAGWTYLAWGAIHGLGFVPVRLREGASRVLSGTAKFLAWLGTLHFVLFAWVFFRAPTLSDAMTMLWRIATWQEGRGAPSFALEKVVVFGVSLLAFEFVQRHRDHEMQLDHWPRWIRAVLPLTLTAGILLIGNFDNVPFIYFQF